MATKKRLSSSKKLSKKLSKKAGTFARIEAILGGIVDRPAHDKIADLEAFAKQDPDNPAPLLVAVMVASFARDNHLGSREYLEEARDRLVRANSRDPEMAFSAALYQLIEAELGIYKLHGRTSNLHRQQAFAKRSAAANKALAKAAKALNEPLADLIVACTKAMSQAHEVDSTEFKSGMRALKKAAGGGKQQDMASFFLVYAHRRAHDYRGALKVAHAMEKRQPNSSMLKKMIGSCYQYEGKDDKAVSYFKQAVSLAPKDPSTHHGLARAHLAAARHSNKLVDAIDSAKEFSALRFKVPR